MNCLRVNSVILNWLVAVKMDLQELLDVGPLGALSDEEIEDGILHHILSRQVPRRRAWDYGHFDIENMTEDDVKLIFRFEKQHINQLSQVLRIPNEIRTQERHVVGGRFHGS